MAIFEYRYSFCVDEDIIRRYNCRLPVTEGIVRFAVEIRSNFMVKGRGSFNGERMVGSERYAIGCCREELLREDMVLRLQQYWMSDYEIEKLIDKAVLFGNRIAASGRRGKIPIGVNLTVYTLQQEGEAIEATVDRAMRPEHLPPLYLWLEMTTAEPNFGARVSDQRLEYFVKDMLKLKSVRVLDVEEASSVMEICEVCRGKGMVGTEISSLRCGHAFHSHCIVRRLLEDKCCPICHCQPYDPPPPPPHPNYKLKLFTEHFFVPPSIRWNPTDDFL
ncbi:hypothetical protein OROGR_019137 [Orobanche gracilis]